MKNSVQNKVLKRVSAKGRGWVFSASDLLDLGSRAAVDQSLFRLKRDGRIRRIGWGLYDFPKAHPTLGQLAPAPHDIAQAVARARNLTLHISGARAANQLGLSTQVPAKLVYATDGATRRVRVGRQVVEFRHTARRFLKGADTPAGAALQALRHLGKGGVTPAVIARLTRTLSADNRKQLRALLPAAPAWAHPAIEQIAVA